MTRIRYLGFSIALTTGLSCGGDSTGPASVASIKVSPTASLLGVGRAIQIEVRLADRNGTTLPGREVSFISSAPHIAEVSATGSLTGRAVGSAVITVRSEAVSATIPVTVVSPTPVDIVTTIRNPFSNTLATDISATLRGVGESLVSPAFVPSMQQSIAGSIGLPAVADFVVGSASNQWTLPAVAHYTSVALPSAVTVIAVPNMYSMVKAFTKVCNNTSSQDCQSFYPQYFKSGVKTWADASLPIPVMFDRTRSNVNISAADSAQFWFTMHNFEGAIERTLFTPATMNTTPEEGYITGAITIAVDNTISYSGGQADWYWNDLDEIQAARISFKSVAMMLSGPLSKHEMMHALGFHHTCQWPSVMGGYGCDMNDFTDFDGGYARAAWRVRDEERQLRTSSGELPNTVLSLAAIAEGEALSKSVTAGAIAANKVTSPSSSLRPPRPFNPLSLPGFAGGDSAH